MKYWLLLITITLSHFLRAQSDPQYTHFMFINPYFNPAAAGINNRTDLALLYRYQWAGYASNTGDIGNASPRSNIIMGGTKINLLNSGIGAFLQYDQLGPYTNTNVILNYSYHLKIGEGRLGIGFGAGIYNRNINTSNLRYIDNSDPTIEQLSNIGTKPQFDVSAGLYYWSKNFTVGLSSTHLNEPKYSPTGGAINRMYYITGSYNYELSELFTISPSVFVKNSTLIFQSTSVDIATLLKYNKDQFWGGFNFRSSEAVSILLGIGLLKDYSLRIGYAFDLTVLGRAAKAGTSHEFYLTYSKVVPDLLPKPIIRTPRYRF